MPEALKPDDFRSLTEPLKLEVRIANALVPVELTVESVQTLPPHRLRAAPFCVFLCGPVSPALPQATYALRHPRLGPIELFLVPVGRDAKGVRYEATFN
jgi:hypothetical protein